MDADDAQEDAEAAPPGHMGAVGETA
jgi:hypothetical protein